MNLQGTSLIGNETGSGSESPIHGINPATGETLEPPYPSATGDEVDRACTLAREAFGKTSRLPGKDKAAFLRKTADQGHRVPWHEDSAYWDGRLTPMEVVCVNLALSPSTEENGCMRVLPGTQNNTLLNRRDLIDLDTSKFVLGAGIHPDQIDETGGVAFRTLANP